jgi:hypothetical protein
MLLQHTFIYKLILDALTMAIRALSEGEHPRVREITYAWLLGLKGGPKKDWIFRRDGKFLYMDPHIAAIKFQTAPLIIYGNSDAGHGNDYCRRDNAMKEEIEEYLNSKGGQAHQFSFSLVRRAGLNPSRLEVLDAQECETGYLLLAQRERRLLVGLAQREKEFLFGPEYGCLVSPECKNVRDAIDFLKPEVVKQALEEGREVKRQGEWFFVEKPKLADKLAGLWENEKLYKESRLRGYVLPHRRGQNVHVAHRGCLYEGNYYATGTIRHHLPSRFYWHGREMGAGHPMLKLEGPWLAVKNMSLGNFSPLNSSGRGGD